MFVLSIKLDRGKVLIGVLTVALVFAIGYLSMRALNAGDLQTSAPPAQMTEEINIKKVPAKTNEQRVAFVESFGWQVAAEPVEVIEVIIPKEFDEIYEKYNMIQKKQGLDLEKFAGKRVKRYAYEITNYPDKPEGVRVNLLVQGGKIIGGDICSLEENGFIHGFAKPEISKQ